MAVCAIFSRDFLVKLPRSDFGMSNFGFVGEMLFLLKFTDIHYFFTSNLFNFLLINLTKMFNTNTIINIMIAIAQA